MEASLITNEDINFLTNRTDGELNLIITGMVSLINNTENKIHMLENQVWYQRMCKTIFGKNKGIQKEIQRNHDKIQVYVAQAMSLLFEKNHIDQNVMVSLGNQINTLYMEHLHLKQILGAFSKKLDNKIEGIHNFHLLNEEIKNGFYSSEFRIVSLCKILSLIDKQYIKREREMNVLMFSMEQVGILNDEQIKLGDFLKEIIKIPLSDIGIVHLELSAIHDSFLARIILELIEKYHFLSEIKRKCIKPQAIIEEIIECENLDSNTKISSREIYNDFLDKKIVMLEDLLATSNYLLDSRLLNSEKLFLSYNLDEAFDIFLNLAEEGNGRALYFLGEYYREGYGKIERDIFRAKELFERGSENGDELSTLKLLLTLQEESQEKQDFTNSFISILKLSKNGDVIAQEELSNLYLNGYGCSEDVEEAIFWLQKASEQEYWKAEWCLGELYYYGEKITQDYEEAIKWYKKSAEQGNGDSQNSLGVIYEHVYEDYEEAIKWYIKSADQCNGYAQYNLGYLYENGYGVSKDCKEAVKWYKKSAEQGHIYAQNNLGDCYYFGNGVNRSYEEAMKWYIKSVEGKNDLAQYNLGFMYEQGQGVKKNYEEAVNFYKESAEQGNEYAQNRLGYMYENGFGIFKNYEEAIKWYTKSAEQGNAESQYDLGRMNKAGKGCVMNYSEAMKWFRKSAEQGNETAKKEIANFIIKH